MNKRLASLTLALATLLAGLAVSQEPPPSSGGAHSRQAPGQPPRPRDQRGPGGGQFFHSLSPEQQERFLKLLDEWSKLTPEQRQQILNKFEQNRNLTPEQRDRLHQSLARFEQMPPEQRDRIRDHLHKWRQMSPEEREKFREHDQEMRQKAEADLTARLNELGLHPDPEQMRLIRQFYFQQKREMLQKVGQRVRELKGQASSPPAAETEKPNLRHEVQQYRQQLEEAAKNEFEQFARDPHPLPPPKEFRTDSPRGGKPPSSRGGRFKESAPEQQPPPGTHGSSADDST